MARHPFVRCAVFVDPQDRKWRLFHLPSFSVTNLIKYRPTRSQIIRRIELDGCQPIGAMPLIQITVMCLCAALSALGKNIGQVVII